MKAVFFLIGLLAVLPGCMRPAPRADAPVPSFTPLTSPAGPSSQTPSLTTGPDGKVVLSWTERAGEGKHALRYAVLEDDAWSAPHTIAEGDRWFVNWADFPSVAAHADGALTAHYLAMNGDGKFAYDVRVTRSDGAGQAWTPAVTPHRDGVAGEHGFVSMVAGQDGRTGLIWLDGRNTGGGGHGHGGGAMTLRFAEIDRDGALHEEAELDARTCDCCQTTAVATPQGLAVFYRDRSEGEMRDITMVRRVDGTWTAPKTLHADGWEIHGCPVNGPAAAAQGQRLAVAWFTAANDTARVQVLFSEDAGATFGAPIRVDDGRALGRVDVELLEDGRAAVSWLETTGPESAEIRMRFVHPDGTATAAQTVATTSPARASGFPRMTRQGDRLFLAWTEAGETLQVRTAVATIVR